MSYKQHLKKNQMWGRIITTGGYGAKGVGHSQHPVSLSPLSMTLSLSLSAYTFLDLSIRVILF